MVVVLGGERGTAFGVDAILDEQEVLVKRLGWPLTKVRHVTGATVLADGRAAPILNVAELLQSALQSTKSADSTRIKKQNYRRRNLRQNRPLNRCWW